MKYASYLKGYLMYLYCAVKIMSTDFFKEKITLKFFFFGQIMLKLEYAGCKLGTKLVGYLQLGLKYQGPKLD